MAHHNSDRPKGANIWRPGDHETTNRYNETDDVNSLECELALGINCFEIRELEARPGLWTLQARVYVFVKFL